MKAPTLFVRDDDGEVAPIATLEDFPSLDAKTLVATSPRERFLPLDEAIETRPDVRDALLGLSPDPRLDRWSNVAVRSIAFGAPFAWSFYVVARWRDAVTTPQKNAALYLQEGAVSKAAIVRRTDGARIAGDLVDRAADHVTLLMKDDEELAFPTASIATLDPVPVVVATGKDGVTHRGTLVDAVREDHLTLDDGGARQTYAWADLATVESPAITVTLADRSTIHGVVLDYVPGARATLGVDAGETISVPSSSIAHLETRADDVAAEKPLIERILAMQEAEVFAEIGMLVAAIVVIAAGLRRWRPIPIAIGAASAAFFLLQAGRPGHCFTHGVGLDWVLIAVGAISAIAAFLLAPGESRIIAGLRSRLKLPNHPPMGPLLDGERRKDFAATLGATGAGLIFPVLFFKMPGSDRVRILFFVAYCTIAFFGFLAWRRERARSTPRWIQIGLAATLGYGVLSAAALTMTGGLAITVEAEKCWAPEKPSTAAKIQAAGEAETQSARRHSQTDLVAFLIPAVLSPICEELLYRGAIQRVARRSLGSRLAILLSGVVFGVAHLGAFKHAFYQHVGLGLAFGAIYELAGGGPTGVVATTATHIFWNAWLSLKPVLG